MKAITCTRCGSLPRNGRLARGLCGSCVVATTLDGSYEAVAKPFELVIHPGSRKLTSDGYVTVATNYGRMPEHRAVMQQVLGRPLVDSENVHHVNGDRSDNRPDNLELWCTFQPAGQRVQDKMAWARELIARYEPLGF